MAKSMGSTAQEERVRSTVKTRILIISDTHCAPLSSSDERERPIYPPFKTPLPVADLLIHCGDLTHTGRPEEYERALDMLGEIEAPVKLVIAGNHDLSLDKDYILGHIGECIPGSRTVLTKEAAELKIEQAHDLWLAPNGRARMEGVTFLEEGIHDIDLTNGARVKVYASPYTPEFHDFGFAFEKEEDRFNPPGMSFTDAKNIATNRTPYASPDSRVDIVITHGPPFGRRDETQRGENVGCPHLLKALMRSRPLICAFGHIHEAWGAERVRWSSTADEVALSATSIEKWKQGGWQKGVDDGPAIQRLDVDMAATKDKHSVFVDLSSEGGNGLKTGESMLINASIMNLRYRPTNPPWLLDVDLPRAEAR